jgi:hypothetical protein
VWVTGRSPALPALVGHLLTVTVSGAGSVPVPVRVHVHVCGNGNGQADPHVARRAMWPESASRVRASPGSLLLRWPDPLSISGCWGLRRTYAG